MQTVSPRIRTRFVVSISYDDIHCDTSVSFDMKTSIRIEYE